jgi:hypothetical protein
LGKRSLAFPFLPLAEVVRFLYLSDTQDETSVVRSFRQWVRRQILPKLPPSAPPGEARKKNKKK